MTGEQLRSRNGQLYAMLMKGCSCRWRWQATGVLALLVLLSSAAGESSTITVSISPIPSPSPSPSPTPHPIPSGVVNITEPNCLYVWIERIDFNFITDDPNFPNISTRSLASLDHVHITHNLTGCSNIPNSPITFTQYYSQKGQELFNFTMILRSDPSSVDQLWYMESFRHRNLSQQQVVNFEYSGVQQSIKASGDVTYHCDDLGFMSGESSAGIHSKLTFHSITIQAFNLKGSQPSKTFSICGLKSENNRTINITIGLAVGVTIVVALIIILITLIVRKLRTRGYNLLDY